MLWLACTVESLQNSSDSLNNVFYATFSREPSVTVLATRSYNTSTKDKKLEKVHNEKNVVESS